MFAPFSFLRFIGLTLAMVVCFFVYPVFGMLDFSSPSYPQKLIAILIYSSILGLLFETISRLILRTSKTTNKPVSKNESAIESSDETKKSDKTKDTKPHTFKIPTDSNGAEQYITSSLGGLIFIFSFLTGLTLTRFGFSISIPFFLIETALLALSLKYRKLWLFYTSVLGYIVAYMAFKYDYSDFYTRYTYLGNFAILTFAGLVISAYLQATKEYMIPFEEKTKKFKEDELKTKTQSYIVLAFLTVIFFAMHVFVKF